MTKVSIQEAHRDLPALLERVAAGEDIVITREGKVIARITQEPDTATLPDLSDFRASIRVAEGKRLDNTVQRLREEQRY
jgi:antitoxin (DNA-binding transcriptional repressor) of toxin-antitoxin stability system